MIIDSGNSAYSQQLQDMIENDKQRLRDEKGLKHSHKPQVQFNQSDEVIHITIEEEPTKQKDKEIQTINIRTPDRYAHTRITIQNCVLYTCDTDTSLSDAEAICKATSTQINNNEELRDWKKNNLIDVINFNGNDEAVIKDYSNIELKVQYDKNEGYEMCTNRPIVPEKMGELYDDHPIIFVRLHEHNHGEIVTRSVAYDQDKTPIVLVYDKRNLYKALLLDDDQMTQIKKIWKNLDPQYGVQWRTREKDGLFYDQHDLRYLKTVIWYEQYIGECHVKKTSGFNSNCGIYSCLSYMKDNFPSYYGDIDIIKKGIELRQHFVKVAEDIQEQFKKNPNTTLDQSIRDLLRLGSEAPVGTKQVKKLVRYLSNASLPDNLLRDVMEQIYPIIRIYIGIHNTQQYSINIQSRTDNWKPLTSSQILESNNEDTRRMIFIANENDAHFEAMILSTEIKTKLVNAMEKTDTTQLNL